MQLSIQVEGDIWMLKVLCGEHNHDLPNTLVGHAYAARLTQGEKGIVVDMSVSGSKPRDILTVIKRQNETNMSTMKTIYNAKAKMKVNDLQGRTLMQQLMKLLDQKKYVHWYRNNTTTDEVEDIFWAHPQSILLARCFPSVILVDCTYKTNRYQMPLLEIVGLTSTSKIFCIAFAFLHGEWEENYHWAYSKMRTLFDPNALPGVFVTDKEWASINAIAKVFLDAHRLLCTFHISKKVEQHSKDQCKTKEAWTKFIQEWHGVIQSETQFEFIDRWETFKSNWLKVVPKCIDYLAKTWLLHKENFVHAWTNLVKHRGNRTTNRVEGTHAKLKRLLGNSQGTFTLISEKMHDMVESELNKIKADLEKSSLTNRYLHNIQPLFKELRGRVSHVALDLILPEIARIQFIGIDISSCGHVIRSMYGVPCSHECMQYQREGRAIPLSALDPHWKKLSILPDLIEHDDMDYEPEMQMFKKRWAEAIHDERQAMLKKLKEIASPSTTSLIEPTPIANKGRPKKKMTPKEKKMDKSTKRDHSGFEYAALSSFNVNKIEKEVTTNYLNFLPKFIQSFISKIEDVDNDENCGYRSITSLMGWSEESWRKVRWDLLQEMINYREMYERMFGSDFHKEVGTILDFLG